MKITIELTDAEVEVLGKWASVSRTLNCARTACDAALGEGDHEPEHTRHCRTELEILEPRLNSLHQRVREQIWIVQALTA